MSLIFTTHRNRRYIIELRRTPRINYAKNVYLSGKETKEVGKGTGLGLAMVYGIVKQNNGCITVESEPGNGTTFRIYLPAHLEVAESQPENSEVMPSECGVVLLVEDEPAVLETTAMMLQHLGYKVVAAGSPGEAIRISHEHKGTIDVLLSDIIMPEMNGRDLAAEIGSVRPGIRCLFMSGYTADVIGQHGVLEKDIHFLQKPFSMKSLSEKLQEVIHG